MAIKLRSTKMTYEEIASRTGYSNASACRKAIMREMERCVATNVNELRTEELDSLERLEHQCWTIFADDARQKSQLFAVDRILQIKDARAKLMGLYARADALPPGATVVREIGAEVDKI
jgi:hypothetical protein